MRPHNVLTHPVMSLYRLCSSACCFVCVGGMHGGTPGMGGMSDMGGMPGGPTGGPNIEEVD